MQAGRRCPVPALLRPNGGEDEGATAHLRSLTSDLPSWEAAHFGRKTGLAGCKRKNPDSEVPPNPAATPRPRLLAQPRPPLQARLEWTPHLAVHYAGRPGGACLRCGATAPPTDPRGLRGTSCGGEVAALPARVRRELLAGLFDTSLAEASAEANTRAQAIGWRPLHPPPERLSGRAGRGAVD